MDELEPPTRLLGEDTQVDATGTSSPDELVPRALGDEARRTTGVGLVAVVVCSAIATYFFSFAPEQSVSTQLAAAYFGACMVVAAVLFALHRRGAYGEKASTAVGVMATLGCLGACAYVGPASMAVVPLPLLVYYYGLVDSPQRRAVSLVVVVGYAGLLLLTALSVVPILGLAAPSEAYAIPSRGYLFEVVFVELVLVVALVQARLSRRSTLRAFEALERARVKIAQRNALLEEARANLDRFVQGARVGRWSGRAIDGFEVGEVIGRGAMGEVYEATDPDGATCAIKVLHAKHVERQTMLDRFLREVEVTAALETPRTVRVLASGRAPDGSPFLAMERLIGDDLGSLLRGRDRLSVAEIDALTAEVCEGLEAAHRAGVVHRDVKPTNLFRGLDGRGWVILDFGVSRLLEPGNTITKDAVVGTPSYMAPEQVVSSRVGPAADVFALGAVLYRALTGRPAFSARSPAMTMFAVHHRQPVRPSALTPVSEAHEAVLALALAKDVEARLPSAAALADAWAAASRGQLPDALAERARRVLAAHPWGATRMDQSSSTASSDGSR